MRPPLGHKILVKKRDGPINGVLKKQNDTVTFRLGRKNMVL